MIKNFFSVLLLLAVLSVAGLVGCGNKDEAPAAGTATRTKALVPDSVVKEELEQAPLAEGEIEAPAESEVISPEHSGAVAAAAEVDPVETPASPEAAQPITQPVAVAGNGDFSLQLGSFTVARFAEEKAAQLRDLGHPATVEEAEVGGQIYHRVFIRGLADHQSAEKLGEELRSGLGLSYLIRRK